jgi:hypothetical protein
VELLRLDEVFDAGKLADDGSVLLVLLDLGVLEVLDEVVEPLQTRVGDVADLSGEGVTF